MNLTEEAFEELEHIHFKEIGKKLSDRDALEMGTRLISFLRVIANPILKRS